MVGICLIQPESGDKHEVDQWFYLMWELAPDGVWSLGPAFGVQGVNVVSSLADLPAADVVVVQPLDGTYVQGTEPVGSFIHPTNAIYVFGGSNYRVTEDDISGAAIHSKVYIPKTGNGNLHAPLAGAIVLFDRMTKNG